MKTLLQVQSLVGGLRSHMPHGQKTKHKLETNSVQILKMVHIQKKKKKPRNWKFSICVYFFLRYSVISLRYSVIRLMLCLVALVAQWVNNLPAIQETWVQSLGWEDPLEKGMTTHSTILA